MEVGKLKDVESVEGPGKIGHRNIDSVDFKVVEGAEDAVARYHKGDRAGRPAHTR